MVVPANEGSFSIIYKQIGVPIGAGEFDAYLARPDAAGPWPVVVVLPSIRGLGSAEKAIARHLAKHGRAVLVVDPYRGEAPGPDATLDEAAAAYAEVTDDRVLADLAEVAEYLAAPSTAWADDLPPILLGFDTGGRFALLAGLVRREVRAVVAVSAPLVGTEGRLDVLEHLSSLAIPALGLYGAEDEFVDVADVDQAQESSPSSRFVVYEGVGHDFMDPSSDGYHPGAEGDALARIRGFVESVAPIPV